ncbi:MAG: DoxX family protein [Kofleriaceae bacterium]|nr:DoxX family protein [Kofleriaceae bacterium]
MTKLRELFRWVFNPPTAGPKATLLIRLMTGSVFLWEGILKFVFPSLGVVRFTKLGMPWPELTATFVGCLEIIGGASLILGLATRFFAIAFIIEMIVAILSTKIPIYQNTNPLPAAPAPPTHGLAAALHDGRTDLAQLLTSIFLLIVGPGPWSVDALIKKHRHHAEPALDTAHPVA